MYLCAIIVIAVVLIAVNAYVKRNPISRNKVTHKIRFDKRLYNPGEEIILTTQIENNSTFPMRRLYVKHTVDSEFNVQSEEKYKISNGINGKKEIFYRTDLDKKSLKEMQICFKIDKRGVYYANQINLEYVDFLGLHSAVYEKEDKQKIIVAPKRVSNKFLDKIIAQGYGDGINKRGYINDETSIRSYGEYTGHEPMRHINWKKTAQSDDFMVKQFEPMGAHVTTIVFDLSGYGTAVFEDHVSEWVEYAISMLREIFEYFEENKIPYRFFTNARSSYIRYNQFSSTSTGNKTRLAKKQRNASVFEKLVAAGKRLTALIGTLRARSNKDIAALTAQINDLCEKWEK
jgi:uncharacterized protein (DUF58 family)